MGEGVGTRLQTSQEALDTWHYSAVYRTSDLHVVHVDHMLPSRFSEQQREGITEDMFDCLPSVGGVQRAETIYPEGQPD